MVDARGVRSVMRAVFFAVIVMVLFFAVPRWRAASALGAARERTAALGLRLDEGAREFVERPDVREFFQRLEVLLDELGDDSYQLQLQLEAEGMELEAAMTRSERDVAVGRAAELLGFADELGTLDVRLPEVVRVERAQPRAEDTRRVLMLSKYLEDASLARMEAGSIDMPCWRHSIRTIHVLESASYDAWVLWISQLQLLAAACDEIEVTAGSAAAEEARAALREGLAAYDLDESCRSAIERRAKASLDAYAKAFGAVHELRMLTRLTGGRDRDLAQLHLFWADLHEANDLPSRTARDRRLAEIEDRLGELDVERYPLTRMLIPGPSSAWESVDEVTRALR